MRCGAFRGVSAFGVPFRFVHFVPVRLQGFRLVYSRVSIRFVSWRFVSCDPFPFDSLHGVSEFGVQMRRAVRCNMCFTIFIFTITTPDILFIFVYSDRYRTRKQDFRYFLRYRNSNTISVFFLLFFRHPSKMGFGFFSGIWVSKFGISRYSRQSWVCVVDD